MAENSITVEIKGLEGMQAKFDRLARIGQGPELPQAILDGCAVIEARIKQQLLRLVYQTPESLTYQRTQDLLRKTQATGVVSNDGKSVTSGVVAAVGYARYVEYGTEHADGRTMMPPRPFMRLGADASVAEVAILLQRYLKNIT